jgi:hypothetical protein
MEGINKTVKLKNVTLIGHFDNLYTEVMPTLTDCYIIEKSAIDNIENKLQGVKVIRTKAVY